MTPTCYHLRLPKTTSWEGARALQLTDQLLYAYQSLVFRIVAQAGRIEWQIVDLTGREPVGMEQAIRASYPTAEIETTPFDAFRPTDASVHRYLVKYQYAIPEFVAPIRYVDDLREPDPLAAVVQAMSGLQADERIIYTLTVVGIADYAYKEGEKLITRNVYDGSLLGLLRPQKVDRFIPEEQRVFAAKLGQRLYQCLLTVQIDAPERERLQSLLVIDNQTVGFDHPQFNGIRWYDEKKSDPTVYVDSDEKDLASSDMGLYLSLADPKQQTPQLEQLRQDIRLIFEPREIASLWHLPHTGFVANWITWTKATQVELPQVLMGKRAGVCLGINRVGRREEGVFITDTDRSTHSLVVGRTGMGKSNLLHHLIHQDIAQGRGVAVIDPHGDLVRRILSSSIPLTREADVVLLDLANEEYSIPLNPMRGLTGEVAVARVSSILSMLYDDLGAMPQTADALENALLTLQSEPEATLRDVNRLFLDEAYRQTVLEQTQDEVAQEFWLDDFGSQTAAQQKQIGSPVIRRIRAFYRNPYLRAIICHPDGLDVARLIREQKIILVSLAANEEHLPQREQRLIGALLLARLQMAVMSGAASVHRFYCYIDEVQHFVTSSLDRVFSEARKFNLSLTVANQYLGQLTGKTLEAVMGNIGALVAFGCSDKDANELAHYTKPNFTPEMLLNLDRFHAAVWMRHNGEQQPAFSLNPLAPLEIPADAATRIVRIRATSIARYTPKPTGEVLAWLTQQYARSTETGSQEETLYDSTPVEG